MRHHLECSVLQLTTAMKLLCLNYYAYATTEGVYGCFPQGFGLCGIPEMLLRAVSNWPEVRNLTAVSNNAGLGDHGLGTLICILCRRVDDI